MSGAATKGRAGLDDYAAPTSLEEAARLAADGPVTILAGGTDLMPGANGASFPSKAGCSTSEGSPSSAASTSRMR